MALPSDEEMARLVRELARRPGLVEQLDEQERAVVRAALDGQSIHEIASEQRLEEAAVWRILDDAARWAIGKPPTRAPEQAGLGSDTEPGIHGGYGDTAFGSLGNEPPIPNPEEPRKPTEAGAASGQRQRRKKRQKTTKKRAKT